MKGMVGIFTKRKTKRIFEEFPIWTQADIHYLIQCLSARKRNLIMAAERFSSYQTDERRQLEKEVDIINQGLLSLYLGRFRSPAKYRILQSLFSNDLREHPLKRKNLSEKV